MLAAMLRSKSKGPEYAKLLRLLAGLKQSVIVCERVAVRNGSTKPFLHAPPVRSVTTLAGDEMVWPAASIAFLLYATALT